MDGPDGPSDRLLTAMEGARRMRRSPLGILLGLLAGLAGAAILAASVYLFYATATSGAPEARPASATAEAAPTPAPILDEAHAYAKQVDSILGGRQLILETLGSVVKQRAGEDPDSMAETAFAVVNKRREVTQDALEEIKKLRVPAQVAEVHRLYVKLLEEDLRLTGLAVAAMRAGDGEKAAKLSAQRDRTVEELMKAVVAAREAAGV